MHIDIKWADGNLQNYGRQLVRLQAQFPKVIPQEINKVGERAKTRVIRTLTKQTGLPRKTIVKAIGRPAKASAGKLSYEMKTRGGDVRLKFFRPRESRKGVIAGPWGRRMLFGGAFMQAGWFPKRVDMTFKRTNVKTKQVTGGWNGNVFRSLGSGKRTDGTVGARFTQVKSGLFIPNEMVRGSTLQAFQATSGPLLKQRIDAVIRKLAP